MAEGRQDEYRSMDDIEKGSDFCNNLKELPQGEPLVLALIGKTGHGKSSTGNSILGKDVFNTSMSFTSITEKTQKEEGIVGGRKIYLVDTPGSLDTRDPSKALKEITNAIAYMPDGFHAILVVIKIINRMTKEEVMAIELLKRLFGTDVMKYVVFVFTNGNSFHSYLEKKKIKMTFEEFISSQNGDLDKYIKECGKRYVLINNMEKNETVLRSQIIQLIETIDKLVASNGGQRFTDDYFSHAQMVLEEIDADSLEKGKLQSKIQEKVHARTVRQPASLKGLKEKMKQKVGQSINDHAIMKGANCFPPDCSVRLEDGSTIKMIKLCVGHKVLSSECRGKLEYSKVYFIAHSEPNYSTEYIAISTLRHKLTLTQDHHIYIDNKGGGFHTVPARKVKIGDRILGLNEGSSCLEEELVTGLSKSIGNGIYAPITMSGNIIVDNVLTSCYVDIVPPKISHPLLWPMRNFDRLLPSLSAWIHRGGNDGMPVWVKWILDLFV